MKEDGFTLMEVMVAVAILTVVAAMLATMTITLVNIFFRERAKTEVNAKARAALDLIGTEVKETTAPRDAFVWDNPFPSGSTTTPCYLADDGTVISSNNTRLIIDIPAINSSNEAIFVAGILQKDTIAYHVQTYTDVIGATRYRLCRSARPSAGVAGSVRQSTDQELLNNLAANSIWAYSNGSCWTAVPATCANASWVSLSFTHSYVNARTGRTGIQGQTPDFTITNHRINFRNQ